MINLLKKPIVTQEEIAGANYSLSNFLRNSHKPSTFNEYLFKTIFRADVQNLGKLIKAYPAEVYASLVYTHGVEYALTFLRRAGYTI